MFFKWSDPYLEKKEFQIIPTFMFLCYLMIAPRVAACLHVSRDHGACSECGDCGCNHMR